MWTYSYVYCDYHPTYLLINTIYTNKLAVVILKSIVLYPTLARSQVLTSIDTTHQPPPYFRSLQRKCNPVHNAIARTEIYL